MQEQQSPDRSGALWLVQAFSGLLLILVLGLHMIAHHFVVEGGLRDFADVIKYVSNPLIFALEILFLLVVIPHAMLGMRAILLDLGLGKQRERVINWFVLIVGVVTLAYGVWLALAIQTLV
jgi:succinate dehydrogenase hydrophobic anchor subunit